MKIMKNFILTFSLVLIITSCVSKNEYDKLVKEKENLIEEIKQLKTDLEIYRSSPSKLCANANQLLKEKKLDELKNIKEILLKYHPESEELKNIEKYCNQLEILIKKEKKEEEIKRMQAVSKLKKKYDDISGITWYENPYFVHYDDRNLTSIYIGKKDQDIWLRLKMSYTGEDWIFFESAYLSYDGMTRNIFFNEYKEKESDHSGGNVWEWIDVEINESLLEYLREMVNGKSVKMRLSGKYTKTRNLSSSEIKGIKDVILAYDVLKAEIK